jgi:hypothetical protein
LDFVTDSVTVLIIFVTKTRKKMSRLSVKELSSAIGVKDGTIRQHIKRKLLQKGDDGLIDTDLDLNSRYIYEKTNGAGLFKGSVKVIEVEKEKEKPTGFTESQKMYNDIDLRTKIATAESKEREVELKKIQIQKTAGRLLPVELVEKIFTINIQGIFKTFEGELENIASIYSEVLGGSRKELADIIGKQREVLSKAIEKAKEDSEYEIDLAVDQYKEVRSRGERK